MAAFADKFATAAEEEMKKEVTVEFYCTLQILPNILLNRIKGESFIIISAPIFGSLLVTWHDEVEKENM